MTPDTPCDRCGAPAVRQLAVEYLCHACTEAILDPIRDAVAAAHAWGGVGRITTPRPDYGPGWHDLRCNCCGATWVGHAGDQCEWCERTRENVRRRQAELVLEPPDIDPDDATYVTRMTSWAQRMARAVEAEHITRKAADIAWRRATQRPLRDAG